jgi:hypothetical protein
MIVTTPAINKCLLVLCLSFSPFYVVATDKADPARESGSQVFEHTQQQSREQSGEQTVALIDIQTEVEVAPQEKKRSPWLLTPTLSSDPKLGTSLGFVGAYLKNFDETSPVSTFGLGGTYSSTDSQVLALFAKTYFSEDKHRIKAAVVTGEINNDFSDFLGTGLSVQTTDDIRLAVLRYQTRVAENWYLGFQAITTNYVIGAENALVSEVLKKIGLTGFDSNGVGVVLSYDSRDNQNSPKAGQVFELHNIAYREGLGGDVSFDSYSMKYKGYISHGASNLRESSSSTNFWIGADKVLAYQLSGRWSQDAPPGGFSSVNLRGYTAGQFLAPNVTSIEIEERLSFSSRWGAAYFIGAACLYDGLSDCGDGENWYPNIGAGVRYVIRPEEKMILRFEYAMGKGGTSGLYLNFGQAF